MAFMTSGWADVYRVTTDDGYEIKATKWHDFYTSRGKIALGDLKPGDEIWVQSGKGQFGPQGSEDLGILLGLIAGDGHFCNRGKGANAATVTLWNEERALAGRVAATINGRQVPLQQLADECVDRYGKEVLDGEINRLVLLQELQKNRKTVADAAIDEEIARAADSYGYVHADGTPDVDTWLKTVTETDGVTVELYVRDAVWPSVALKQLVGEKVEVKDEDLQKGFASNYGERVEVLAIVLIEVVSGALLHGVLALLDAVGFVEDRHRPRRGRNDAAEERRRRLHLPAGLHRHRR